MKKSYLHLVLFFFFSINATAQHQNIKIVDTNSPNEPTIAIDPNNTQRIIGGSNLNIYFYSNDGGYTWQNGILTSVNHGVWGDPVTLVDNEGNYYFFHLSNPASGNWIDRIVCQKYDKTTGQWNNGTYMGLSGTKAQDKHWAVVDPQTNTIYVTWTQFDDYGSSDPGCQSNIRFSKSTDAGQSWSEAVIINQISGNCIDSDETTEGAVPAVGPNGEVYVSWSGPEGIVFDRSLDGGQTWLNEDIPVDPHIGGWDINIPGIMRSNGMPVTVCDLSPSPHNGTIYINFADQRNGSDDTDIWLTKSTDQGNSWSEPVRVNDDPPGKHQFFTWMTIDQTNGYLYFVFYDRRAYNDNQTDVYLAWSGDGGETFTNVKISESPFVPTQNIFFGDYNNISAHNNMVRPIWTRMDDGVRSIYTAIVDMTVGMEPQASIPFSITQNYPNPFNSSTIISYKIQEAGQVSLIVYDQMGRMVAQLFNQKWHDRGKYEFVFQNESYQLKTGVYAYELQAGSYSTHRKMVIAND